ncbi:MULTISPECIES: 3-oxoacyl-ACP synthase [Dickeya]|uniref:3-Oxoacyl-(Acyl-carrier-protein (ACP)) synthase III domain protein n=1 Tax=Dickeya aquatica TaxID=1401087 RepID=A0A375AGE3_9GAMM|nr:MULTISPECIES: 3-oxoacyl-ACP synthase [Dickeya]SLM65077.1 3-Oxoacyl-(acyl-carrier-protein (ACP)) synthase III domain protein [Dickeya aquatica]
MRLTHVVTWVPEPRLSAQEIIGAAGASASEARIFSQLFGFQQVAVLDANLTLTAVFSRLLTQLQQHSPRPQQPVDALIYAHGMPVQYATSSDWLTQLGRTHPFVDSLAPCYELDQQNCATLFWALALAQRLLAQQKAARVAIIAGDTFAAYPVQERYVPGCSLAGDAFAALLLEEHTDGLQLGPVFMDQRMEFHEGLYGDTQALKAFYQAHDDMVNTALWGALAPHTDIARHQIHLLPHNVNRLSWLNYSRRHQHPLENISLGLMPDIGHCYTVDPLLLLPAALPAIRKGQPHVMLSVGLGAWIGSCRISDNGPPVDRRSL